MVTATKRHAPSHPQLGQKLETYLPNLHKDDSANYFAEIHDELLTNYRYFNENDSEINEINRDLISQDKDKEQRIGLVFMGKQAPGGQNVVDGLLRY